MTIGAVLQWFSVSMGVAPKAYTESRGTDTAQGQVVGHAGDASQGHSGAPVDVQRETLPRVVLSAGGATPDDGAGTSALRNGSIEPSHLDLYFPAYLAPVASVPVVQAASGSGQLTEEQAIAVLQAAQWPTELIPQALAVAWCESKWSPGANGDSGRSKGWFQLNSMWFGYAGEDPEQWADALVNARVAWATYNYDLSRGQRAWQQWSCRSAVY